MTLRRWFVPLLFSVLSVAFAVIVFAQPVEQPRPLIWELGTTDEGYLNLFWRVRVIVVDTPGKCFYVFQHLGSQQGEAFKLREVARKDLPAGKGCQ